MVVISKKEQDSEPNNSIATLCVEKIDVDVEESQNVPTGQTPPPTNLA